MIILIIINIIYFLVKTSLNYFFLNENTQQVKSTRSSALYNHFKKIQNPPLIPDIFTPAIIRNNSRW